MAALEGKTVYILIAVAIFGAMIFYLNNDRTGPAVTDWKEGYTTELISEGIELSYLDETKNIDITPEIQTIADQISAESKNTKDAVKNTLEFVYQHVRYTASPPGCYAETASDVLRTGAGNCVSMTKLNIALLRAQGIVARPVGGCISSNFACSVMFSFNQDRMPKYVPVSLDDNYKRGGLHEWLEIWLPDEGWIIGEATSGQIFPKECLSYNVHDYNTDSTGMCVITDINYIKQCARY